MIPSSIKLLIGPYADVNKKSSSSGHAIGHLDGVRGLAVLIVLASHTASFGMYAQGSLGVMLFYVLSGYVLSIPFVANPHRILSVKAIIAFFWRRALRIVPIYWVTILLVAAIFNMGPEWIFWNASFIKGWNHFWSVAQETRFYLLFPFVIVLLAAVPTPFRLPILLALGYTSFRSMNMHLVDMMDGRRVGFYFFMFLAGVVSCFAVHALATKQWVSSRAMQVALALISALIFIGFFFSSTYWVKEFWSSTIGLPETLVLNGWARPGTWAIIFCIFLGAITLNKTCAVSRLLNSYFFRHIGLLSYGIYLLHMIFLQLLLPQKLSAPLLFAAVFGFTYLAALLSYSFIEKPFLLLKTSTKIK